MRSNKTSAVKILQWGVNWKCSASVNVLFTTVSITATPAVDDVAILVWTSRHWTYSRSWNRVATFTVSAARLWMLHHERSGTLYTVQPLVLTLLLPLCSSAVRRKEQREYERLYQFCNWFLTTWEAQFVEAMLQSVSSRCPSVGTFLLPAKKLCSDALVNRILAANQSALMTAFMTASCHPCRRDQLFSHQPSQ